MITKPLALIVAFFVLLPGFCHPAQQSEADRKLLADIRANAEKGDSDAQTDLGEAYFYGYLGLAKDFKQAVKWIRKAAENNHPNAQFNLGCCYAKGTGVTKDLLEAVKWYRKAADQNNVHAQNNLGFCYSEGQGVGKDDTEAGKWFRKAAEQNDATAQFNLGNHYVVTKEDAEAVKWFRKAAEQNNTSAQFNLGICLNRGIGVDKNELEAVKWFRRAAGQESPPAQLALGYSYARGGGVPKSDVEAVKWFRKAAEQNYAEAQTKLGACYSLGKGVEKDVVEAVKWYRKAAEQNDSTAQFNLAICYMCGSGVLTNYIEAVKWYRKAAEQNFSPGQYQLGCRYLEGDGVAKNEIEAAKWLRRAAEQNFAEAQAYLGYLYIHGTGVPQDFVEAYKWCLLAASQGDEPARTIAKKNIALLEEALTREAIAEGQKLARDFKPGGSPSESGFVSDKSTTKPRPESSGTGFFITEDGYLVTNQHVAGEGAQVRLVTETGLISAKVIKVDVANDLALLKVDGKFAALPVVSSRTVKLGATVATVGFPNIGLQGFAPKLAKGEIAGLSGAQDDARHFQISTPVQPGNSGGALVDERGNVVGVVVAKLSQKAALAETGMLPENVNYAVKSSYLLSFLESVPAVSAKLNDPNTKNRKFEDVVKDAEKAAVLVLVY